MENPIKKEDIIDSAGILSEISKIVDAIKNQLIPAMDLIVKQAKEEKEALAKLSPARKEDQVIIAEKVQIIQALDAEQKKNKQTLTEVEKLEKKIQETWKDSAVNAERLRQQLNQNKKANKDLVESEKYAKGSLADLRKQLIELQKAYIAADPNKAKGMVSGITALRKEVDKAEKAIGSHSRGVGNYKNNIISAAKELFSFAGVAGIATTVMGKLKDAFFATEQGAKITKQWGEGIKTFFSDVIKGNFQMAGANAVVAMKIAKQMDETRKGDREDMIKVATLETEIAVLRYKAADATLSETEQLKNLNIAQEKENELLEYKRNDVQGQLDDINLMLTKRQDDTELLNEKVRLEAELIRLEGDRSLRIEAKSSGIRAKQQKRAEEEIAEQKAISEAYMAAVQMSYATKVDVAKKADIEIDAINRNALVKNDQFYKDQTDRARQAAWDEMDLEQAKRDTTQDIVRASFGLIETLIDRQKNKELEAAGDNAKEREKIEKEYAKKQKLRAIAEATINAALVVMNALKTQPFPLGVILAAGAAAMGAIQIATIAATKFAEGGEVGGRSHAQGGTLIEAEKDEFIVRKKSASKYKGLLKAINEDNPMMIAEELRNKKFHTVWGGVQQSLSGVSKQDPYTRMMYELMRKDIKTYVDSDGNMVVVENGRKRVIKK